MITLVISNEEINDIMEIVKTLEELHIMLPKIRKYVKSYDRQTKWMYFLIEDDELIKTYNTIWDKVSADIKNN